MPLNIKPGLKIPLFHASPAKTSTFPLRQRERLTKTSPIFRQALRMSKNSTEKSPLISSRGTQAQVSSLGTRRLSVFFRGVLTRCLRLEKTWPERSKTEGFKHGNTGFHAQGVQRHQLRRVLGNAAIPGERKQAAEEPELPSLTPPSSDQASHSGRPREINTQGWGLREWKAFYHATLNDSIRLSALEDRVGFESGDNAIGPVGTPPLRLNRPDGPAVWRRRVHE
ncbi:hypothetical protein RGU70_15405 [Herbaspirillum sp. RTI4]|uniref:hypothetical protein n=1 Tax=Herbaspirillum sp. RTI4 TaxID=3048640 RepID=UPI002AB3588B|nr:hypothetical protein [Herbaspirillum sp. RTI4]MDY7579700.1 hypothetical protein [Herbaspirillum sp. RTI4]MEA9983027.1 hypothetical protein [Herbaspirillum sp. RTI4]